MQNYVIWKNVEAKNLRIIYLKTFKNFMLMMLSDSDAYELSEKRV